MCDLPKSFLHRKIKDNEFRANLLNKSDIEDWIKEYSECTNTNWTVVKSVSNTPHYICR